MLDRHADVSEKSIMILSVSPAILAETQDGAGNEFLPERRYRSLFVVALITAAVLTPFPFVLSSTSPMYFISAAAGVIAMITFNTYRNKQEKKK